MKKIICILFCFLFLCGCSERASSRTILPVTSGIAFTAEVAWYNEEFVCRGSIPDQNSAEFEVIEPENIEGLTVAFSGDRATVRFQGLERDLAIADTPYSMLYTEIYNAFRDTWKENVDVEEEDKSYVLEGSTGENDYRFTLGSTGLPISLEIPDDGFLVTFRDVTILPDAGVASDS